MKYSEKVINELRSLLQTSIIEEEYSVAGIVSVLLGVMIEGEEIILSHYVDDFNKSVLLPRLNDL